MEFEIDEEVDGNLIIIHGVENHPCLYNKHLKDYRNNLKRKRAWKEIAETYEKETGEKESVDTIKARWTSLRTTFVNEYNKLKEYTPSGSAAAENDEEPWFYYSDCLFLIEHIGHRRMDENFDFSDDEPADSDDEKSLQISEHTDSDCNEDESMNFEQNPSCSNLTDSPFELGAEIKRDEKEVLQKGQEMNDLITFLCNKENKDKLFGYEKILISTYRKLSEEDQAEVFDIVMDIMEAKLNARKTDISLD